MPITEEYHNQYLENLKRELEIYATAVYKNKDEIFLYKWRKILEELKKYSNSPYPINLHTVMNYLMLHLLTKEERNKVKTKELFQISASNEWCFANIYTINLNMGTLYYIHPRYKNQFNLYEINKEKESYYTSIMR